MLFRYRCNTYSRYTDRRKYRLCPEATAMVIYTVLNQLTEGIFSLPPPRAPHAPRRALHARRDCCLLKDYTYFEGIHILWVYIFSRYAFFSIYHIHILPANHHTPDAPAAHYTRAEGLAMRLYVHLYMPWNKRLCAHIYIIIYCPFYVHLYQLILSFFYAIICTPLPTLKSAIICTHIDVFYSHFMHTFICTFSFSFYVHLYIPNKKTAGSFI